MKIRAIRGATTAVNTRDGIVQATKELLQEILRVNKLDIDRVISILFTATADLDAAYPAVAARQLGFTATSLMCAREMHVVGSLPLCVRVQVTAEMDVSQKDVRHVYLKEARALRPDLQANEGKMGIGIAIDGPSGSGKSTIAKAVAARLGFVHVDTGAMYRAVALWAHRAGKNWDNETEILSIMENINIDITYTQAGQRIFVDGEDVTEAVRTAEIGVGASRVAPHAGVREKLVQLQQQMAKSRNVVMDGRDIGTVVLADAPVKIFLTASLEERARRRCNELAALGLPYDFAEIAAQMEKRDFDDSNKSKALRRAVDAVEVDTSHMDIEQTVAAILQIIKEKGVPG